MIGKWHLGDRIEQGPNAQGFDYFWGIRGGCVDNYSHFYYWGGPNRHDLWQNEREIYSPGNFFAAENLKEIKKFATEDKEKPFFIYWAVNIPHYPLQPSEKWLDYYADLPNPRRMYAAFVSTFDDYLGELRTFLAAEGLADNTILIFRSDNGHSMEERTFRGGGYSGPYRAGKFSLFEGGIRVPALICWPKELPQGEVRDQVANTADRDRAVFKNGGDDANFILLRFEDPQSDNENYKAHSLVQIVGRNRLYLNPSNSFKPNEWQHLALVCDGSNYRLYINGVDSGVLSIPTGATTFSDVNWFCLGDDSYSRWGNCKILMSEARIWSVVRSASQIQNNMTQVSPKSVGLEAYWRFNEGQGNVFEDATGKGHTLTTSATPTWIDGILSTDKSTEWK